MPEEDVRVACNFVRPGEQNYLFSPPASHLKPGHPKCEEYTELFQERWAEREPVVVRGVKGQMSWKPDVS